MEANLDSLFSSTVDSIFEIAAAQSALLDPLWGVPKKTCCLSHQFGVEVKFGL